MHHGKEIRVGIGFATGRKSFQKALRTNIHNWKESGLVDNDQISLNLFVAYDLKYNKTIVSDYTNVPIFFGSRGPYYDRQFHLLYPLDKLIRRQIIYQGLNTSDIRPQE